MAQQLLTGDRFDPDASDDATLEALANERRRAILDAIDEDDAPVALADLSRTVAVREADAPLTALSDGYVATVKRSLYHAHLPKLDDLGLVSFDADERTVERA